MTTINKTVNTTETEKEYIPDFIRVGEFFIQDRKNLFKKFDCRQSSQVRAACDMYKILTYPTYPFNKQCISRFYYIRVLEYVIKHKKPDIPNPFNTLKSFNTTKGVGTLLLSVIYPNTLIPDDIAKCIVQLFTTSDINIAIEKCRITGNTHEEYKERYIKNMKEKQVIKNNDLFNTPDKTSDNKDDNFKVLFGVNKADIENVDIKQLEGFLIHNRNVVHFFQHNYVEYEKLMKEAEVFVNQKNRQDNLKFIIECLQTLDDKMLSKFAKDLKRKE